jgi:hypothetical protein
MMYDQSPGGWFNDFFWIAIVPVAVIVLAGLAIWWLI